MTRRYLTLFAFIILTFCPVAFGQMFAQCWDDSGKKVGGSDARILVNLMIKTGILGNHRPQGDDWNSTLNCQNVWVMPNYSRMYYLCSLRDAERTYLLSESDSAVTVSILEAHGFPSKMQGEITRWQVNELICGTSHWTQSID